MTFEIGDILYENPFAGVDDVKNFRLEGDACITFPRGRMRLEQAYERDRENGRHANFVFWCPAAFPADIAVTWEFQQHADCGLSMFWFAAQGRNGRDLFDPSLQPRDGDYPQYHHGDINAYHLAYFRRNPKPIGFQTCNLRKSHGFHLLARAGDPLPSSRDAAGPYAMRLIKCGPHIRFSINDLLILAWDDNGEIGGPPLAGGRIGIRQMAGLIADYANLRVYAVTGR